MNAIKNTVHLVGNLGRDVAITTFESGSKKASVSLATTTYYKNAKGELIKNTQWHNLIAWGRNAELMAKILEKGNQVAITGSLSSRIYEDKEKVSRTITEIIVDEFMKISNTHDSTNASPSDLADSGQSEDSNGTDGKTKARKARAEEAVPF